MPSSSGNSIAPIIAIVACVLLVLILIAIGLVFLFNAVDVQEEIVEPLPPPPTPTPTPDPTPELSPTPTPPPSAPSGSVTIVSDGFPTWMLNEAVYHDGRLYFVGTDFTRGIIVQSIALDNTAPQEVLISSFDSARTIHAFNLTDEGNFRFFSQYSHWDREANSSYHTYVYEIFDRNGAPLIHRELPSDIFQTDENPFLEAVVFLADGSLLISVFDFDVSGYIIYVLDSALSLRGRLESEFIQNIVQSRDGRVFTLAFDERWNPILRFYEQWIPILREIHLESGAWGEPLPFTFPVGWDRFFPAHGNSPFDFHFTSFIMDSGITSFYGYSFATGDATLLFTWDEADSRLTWADHVTFWPDGRISILRNNLHDPGQFQWQTNLVILSP